MLPTSSMRWTIDDVDNKEIIAADALVKACQAAGAGCTLVVGSDGQILAVK